MTHSDFQSLSERAQSLGFDWCAAAAAKALREEGELLAQWIAEGRCGEMDWIAREPDRRADPSLVLSGVKTVIVLGMNYLRERPFDSKARKGFGRISKYALTRDYHRVIEKRLRKLARAIDEEFVPGAQSRGFVDYGPVMERPWAREAGLGFIGKHTLLIHPQQGSFHFLGVILTTANFAAEPRAPVTETCGDCRRCIDACPTGAIDAPYQLDARRCLSYLTIEKNGPIDPEFHPHFEGYIFGCDICQDVCPYNRSRAPAATDSPLGEPVTGQEAPLVRLILDSEGFLEELGETASPLKRAGAESLRRNAAIVAKTLGGAKERDALREVSGRKNLPDWLRKLLLEAAELIGSEAGRQD